MNGGGLHHLSLRKRLAKGLEPYPSRDVLKRALDHLMFFVAFFVPVALLPQVFQIYIHHSAAGLSIYTWSALTVANILWAFYGYVHKDKPILIANILITILNFSVVVGIVMFGG